MNLEVTYSPAAGPKHGIWRRVAAGLKPVMALALMTGLLAIAACAKAPTAPSTVMAAVQGCVEAQRATWTDGSAAPWQACHARTGIQGIEGSNAVNSHGTIFMAAAVLDADGRAGLARSRDGGQSWERVTLPVEFSDIIGYVRVDPATNRLFYMSVARFFGDGFGVRNPFGYSDDDGETWHITRIGEGVTLGDLGTIFVGPPPAGVQTADYPNVIYTCNLTPIPSFGPDFQCWRSLDGGNSFERPSSQRTFRKADCEPVDGPGGSVTQPDIIIPSRGVVGADGAVYVPISACGQFVVGVSRDAGATFEWNPIPGARADIDQAILADQKENLPGCAGSIANAGCPETFQLYGQERLTLGANGTLYFIFNYNGLMLSLSADGGTSWTEPAPMSLPGLQTVWSSIAARGPGQIGLSYLGRSEGSTDWHGYMAMVENADNPSTRTIATARVSAFDNPLMPYRCCGSQALLVPEGSPEADFYNLFEHGGLSFAPDGTLWATFFRDNTRDPNNTESAAYEITAGHMTPVGRNN